LLVILADLVGGYSQEIGRGPDWRVSVKDLVGRQIRCTHVADLPAAGKKLNQFNFLPALADLVVVQLFLIGGFSAPREIHNLLLVFCRQGCLSVLVLIYLNSSLEPAVSLSAIADSRLIIRIHIFITQLSLDVGV
jgi:hypothetical protein